MNNLTAASNEDFLADCTTNVFSLADIQGLRWKKYLSPCTNSDCTQNDPILSAYATARNADVLCVWRRVTQPGLTLEDTTPLFDCTKELILFWYGEEPVLSDFPGNSLRELETGCSEDGISTENLGLFFKSMHSVIEKNLLNSDFVRLGKWFTKPQNLDETTTNSSSSLAFSFSIFIHGESSVVASVTIHEKNAVRPLKQKDLHKACVQVGNESKVLLAPYGLNANLTGHSIPNTDARSSKILDEWKKFFQMSDISSKTTNNAKSDSKIDGLPKIVEVMLGEVKMLYPSSLILIPLIAKQNTPLHHQPKEQESVNLDQTDVSFKLMDRVCDKLKKKEDPAPPNKQLWEFKENCLPSGCKCCSNSNVTRVKSSTHGTSNNPFNTSYLYASNSNTNSQNKMKKETIPTSLATFHQRVHKLEKSQGRITPSLTGRVTPQNNYKISSVNLPGSNDKPGSVSSNGAVGNVDSHTAQSVKKELDCTHNLPVSSSLPSLCSTTYSKDYKTLSDKATSTQNVYHLPKTFDQARPSLPESLLQPRVRFESLHGNSLSNPVSVKTDANESPCSVFADEENEIKTNAANLSEKRSNQLPLISDDVFKKKIKQEPIDTTQVKRGPGRPRGRRNSGLNHNNVLSPINIHSSVTEEDQLLSPNTRRQSARQMLRKRESPTPSPKPDSPPQNGPGRPRKQRKTAPQSTSKTPSTPKTENAVFNFTNSNSHSKSGTPLSSPSTPYFTKLSTSSSSLTRTRDLMATADDLRLLFDEEEEEEDLSLDPNIQNISNSLHSSHGPMIGPHDDTNQMLNALTNNTTTTAAGLTNQDLAQMFPTPPSLEPPHQTMSPTTLDLQTSSTNVSVSLLSPEVQQSISIHENESLEINLISKSPTHMVMLPTFQMPLTTEIPMPDAYQPISLSRSQKYKTSKYIPTWDAVEKPPLLYRLQSDNRAQAPTTATTTLIDDAITKSRSSETMKLTLPLFSNNLVMQKQQILETPTHGFSPRSVLLQDHQSLFLNLRLTDSFMNWCNRHLCNSSTSTTTAISVQDKTYKIFKVYQDFSWEASLPEISEHPLFPEDEPLEHSVGTCLRHTSEMQAARFPFSADMIEILLKTLSSSLSVSYFHLLLSRYYKRQPAHKKRIDKTSLLQKQFLTDLKPFLETALQKPIRKTIFDKPQVYGPLSFNNINETLNGSGLSSAQSSSALQFSYDSGTLSVSPEAMKNWQRLFLEPFGGPRNVEYVVVLPETDLVVNGMKSFFKQLNCLYESLNLGTHSPHTKDIRDGFLRVTQRTVSQVASITVDEWFDQSDSNVMAKMKVVAQYCKHKVGSYVASIVDSGRNTNKKFPGPMSPGINNGGTGISSSSSLTVSLEESIVNAARERQPTIVLYMVDPFHMQAQLQNYPDVWSYVGLMKCFLEMRNDLKDYLKENLLFQVIPLEQILNLSSNIEKECAPCNPELKELALNIYTRCRPSPLSFMNKIDKCMTGFGVCQTRENLVRRRKMENNLPVPIYIPPFILSPSPKYLNNEFNAMTSAKDVLLADKDVNTLFCAYCLSADKQWMFVSCTDNLGQISETTLIKVTYPKKKKNKALIWNIALRKLWEFLFSVLSFSICTWRIVISKYGDIGQSELRELNDIIQKNMDIVIPSSIHRSNRPLSPVVDNCNSCTNDEKKKGNSLYRSITVCTIQKDKNIKFAYANGVRSTNQVNSRIYVKSGRKSFVKTGLKSGGSSMLSATGAGDLLGDSTTTSLLTNSFDDDNDGGFLPMLPSPVDNSSLFQASPQCEISKILSSSQDMTISGSSASMPSLSPFQPIQNKQNMPYMMTPSKSATSQELDTCGCLAVGYLLSISEKYDVKTKERLPEIVKCELHTHMTSLNTSSQYHALDTNNHLEVTKCILEHFEMLSWLTVNPSTGRRQSGLPVHVTTTLSCREILKTLTA